MTEKKRPRWLLLPFSYTLASNKNFKGLGRSIEHVEFSSQFAVYAAVESRTHSKIIGKSLGIKGKDNKAERDEEIEIERANAEKKKVGKKERRKKIQKKRTTAETKARRFSREQYRMIPLLDGCSAPEWT